MDVPWAFRCARRSPLICECPSSAVSGSREPACRACRALARWYSVSRVALTRPGQDGQLAGASAYAAPKVAT
jgi:hypothetical protein